MKKTIPVLLLLIILVLTSSSEDVSAAVGLPMTASETTIAKAYIKAYESGKSSGINKYAYTGTKLTLAAVPKGTSVKVFFPTYCKKYDPESKMNYIFMNCMIVTSNETKLTISKAIIEINLKTKGKKTYAYFKKKPKVTMTEISVGDLSGSHLTSVKTYITDKYAADIASKLLYVKPKKLTATYESPAEIGDACTYGKSFSGKGDKLSGKFSFTVNSVTKLTEADLKKMGYVKSKDEVDRVGTEGYLDYKLVNVTWNVKDAKIVELSNVNKTGNAYVRDIMPKVTGTAYKRESVAQYGAFALDGFTDSFQSKMADKFKSSELKANSTVSFTMTGNIVLPVVHSIGEAYMRIAQPGNDSWAEFMYMKLQ